MKNIQIDLSQATSRQIALKVVEKRLRKYVWFESDERSAS